MRISRVLAGIFALLFCLAVAAQEPGAHPNFTGIWKLDAQRTSPERQKPDSVTLYIHQNDPDFHLRRTEVQHGKSSAWSVHGRTDGKPLEWKSREGIRRTHMYWQGTQLVLEWKNDDKRGETKKSMRYSLTLTDGGRTLIAQELDDNQQTRWVFTKSG